MYRLCPISKRLHIPLANRLSVLEPSLSKLVIRLLFGKPFAAFEKGKEEKKDAGCDWCVSSITFSPPSTHADLELRGLGLLGLLCSSRQALSLSAVDAVCLSVYLSINQSIHLSINQSINQFIYLVPMLPP